MDVFIALLFVVANIALLVGLIKPSIVRLHSRKAVAGIFGALLFGLVILFGVVVEEPTPGVVEIASVDVEEPAEAPIQEFADTTQDAEVEDALRDSVVSTETAREVDASADATVVLPTTDATPPVTSDVQVFAVTQVVDGDTIKVSMNGTVETLRLIGIDTPETKDPRKPVQCFGEEASRKATELLSGRKVRLEADASQGERDTYGRLLRYVWREDGLHFNDWMIRNGYAFEYTYNKPYKYQASFKEAQRYASDNNLGLWSPATCDGEASAVEASAVAPVVVPAVEEGGGRTFYTSSHSTAKYYYCDTDPGWKSLSTTNLRSFSSESALLASYHASRGWGDLSRVGGWMCLGRFSPA